METIDPAFSSFVDAYTDAVIAFIHGGRSQAVFYDRRVDRFIADTVIDGTSPTDVDVWIGQTWERSFENLNCATNKADLDYSAGALRSALARQLLVSPWALQLCSQMRAPIQARS